VIENDTSSPGYVQLHDMLFDPYKLYSPKDTDASLRGAMRTNIERADSYFSAQVRPRALCDIYLSRRGHSSCKAALTRRYPVSGWWSSSGDGQRHCHATSTHMGLLSSKREAQNSVSENLCGIKWIMSNCHSFHLKWPSTWFVARCLMALGSSRFVANACRKWQRRARRSRELLGKP